MPEEKKVKQVGLTLNSYMSMADLQTAHVDERAKSVQDAVKSGALCNEEGAKAKKWDYTIGAPVSD